MATSSQQARYHRIRAAVCRGKAALLDGQYDRAREHADDIRQLANQLRYEAAKFVRIVDYVEAYRDNELSDVEDVLDSISTASAGNGQYDLSLEYDYRRATIAILAAQRLRQQGVDTDLLDRFIRIGFADSFEPQTSTEVASETGLTDVQFGENARTEIPRYIYTRLERLDLRESGLTTEDRSGLGPNLMATLEKHLEVFVEYHAKRVTDNWKELLGSHSDGDLSLGHLVTFFRLDETDELDLTCQDTVREVVDTPVVNDAMLVEIRNDLVHGHIDRFSQEEYAALRTAVMKIIDATATEMPVLATPLSKTTVADTYVYEMDLHWSRRQERTWIETKSQLETDRLYFIGPDAVPEDPDVGRWEIPAESVQPCTERRANEAV
jgi:hypothetical protein